MNSNTIKEEKASSSVENVYKLDGRVPLKKAIPFGLQHVLAMFVSNLAPVLIGGCPKHRGASDFGGDHAAFAERDVCGRSWDMHAALSGLEDRLEAADCHGCEFYLSGKPSDYLYQSRTGI